jgi:hypothetical protein
MSWARGWGICRLLAMFGYLLPLRNSLQQRSISQTGESLGLVCNTEEHL